MGRLTHRCKVAQDSLDSIMAFTNRFKVFQDLWLEKAMQMLGIIIVAKSKPMTETCSIWQKAVL